MCVLAIIIMVILLISLKIFFKRFKKHFNIADDIKKYNIYLTTYRIVRAMIVISCIMALLAINGINISGIAAAIGIMATAVAFAVKDSLQDIFAGFTIMTDKYFSVGDAVEFDGKDGIVVSFSIRTTKIEFLDDRSVMSVANRHITKIKKLTHMVDIDLPLSYEDNRADVYRVLLSICNNIRKISGIEKCELKGTQNFEESAVIYKIRFFCEPNDRPDIRREVMKTIQDGLAEGGIKIPYRQIDIHNK